MPTAVVTGAAGGLGAAIVEQLRSRGYTVVATDIVGAERLLDVGDAAACRALAHEVAPQVWVNCAGVLGPGAAATQPDDQIENIVRTNLLGTIHGTRAAVAAMRGRGSGHIINIASLASWVPVPGETVYAATKAAVLSFTLGLRAELASEGLSGIRVGVVCPDGMLTPMLLTQMDNPAIALSFSGLRMVDPDHAAQVVVRMLDHPRAVRSVPRWRGAQVRLLGVVPELPAGLVGLFIKAGAAQQRRSRKRLHQQASGGAA